VADFARRYMRWSVIHRTAIQPSTYLAQALLNPLPLALLALLCAPSLRAAAALGLLMILKAAIDLSTAGAISNTRFGGSGAAAVWLKDAILFYAWVRGLFVRTVLWRGNVLRVGAGSRLLDRDRLPAPDSSSLPVSLDHGVRVGHGLG
jgi:ceramide glucosyltransferase